LALTSDISTPFSAAATALRFPHENRTKNAEKDASESEHFGYLVGTVPAFDWVHEG
jgi:hypothetical protein